MAVRILFIAGAGRSGTTFLSLLLSQNSDAQNIGQIRDLPQAVEVSAPCSCKRTVPDCTFWGAVCSDFEARCGAGALVALEDGIGAFRRAANADTNWQDDQVRERLASDQALFLELFGALYAVASERAEGRMLIDSSKSVDLALALSLIPEIDLAVLNLVRDPRAVAVSWSKVLKNRDKLRRRTRNWMARQRRLQILRARNPEKFMLLRYEDLTATPRRLIGEVQGWAGLEGGTDFFTDDHSATISWDRAHLFPPANATVLKERRSEIVIRPADGWRQERHAGLHAMAERLTFPYAESLGYQKGADT